MGEPRFITLEEATGVLPLAEITLRRAIRSGELPAYRFGRRLAIRTSDLDDWIESRKVVPTAAPIFENAGPSRPRGRSGGLLDRALKEKRSQ